MLLYVIILFLIELIEFISPMRTGTQEVSAYKCNYCTKSKKNT